MIDQQCSYIQSITSKRVQVELRRRCSEPVLYRPEVDHLSSMGQALPDTRELFDGVENRGNRVSKPISNESEVVDYESETSTTMGRTHHSQHYEEHVAQRERKANEVLHKWCTR